MDRTSRFQTQNTGQQVPLGTGSPGASNTTGASSTTTGSQTSGKQSDIPSSPIGTQQEKGGLQQGPQQQPQNLSSDIGSSGGQQKQQYLQPQQQQMQPQQQQLQPQQRQGMSSSTGGPGMGSGSSSIPISGDSQSADRGRWEFLSQKPLPPGQKTDPHTGSRSSSDEGSHRTNAVERWMRKSMSWQQPHQQQGPILGTRDGLFMFAEGGFGHHTVDSPAQTPVMGPLARPASDLIDSDLGNIPKQPFGGQIPQSTGPAVVAQPPIVSVAGQRGGRQQYSQQEQYGGGGGGYGQQRGGGYQRGDRLYRGIPYNQQVRGRGYDEDWYPGRDDYDRYGGSGGGGQEEYRQAYYAPHRYPQQSPQDRYYDYYDEDYDDYRGGRGQQQRPRDPYRQMGGHRGGYDDDQFEGFRRHQGTRTGGGDKWRGQDDYQQGGQGIGRDEGLNWRQRAEMQMRERFGR